MLQNECEAPERHSKTGKNSAFRAQCNHSHICCLLGHYRGCYRCGKFLTLLLKFIAFFGGVTVSWAKKTKKQKKRLKCTTGVARTVKWLRGSFASWLNLPSTCCHVLERTQQTKHREPAVQVTQEQTQTMNIFIMTLWLCTYTMDIYDRNKHSEIRHGTVAGFIHPHPAKRCQQPPVEKLVKCVMGMTTSPKSITP